METKSPQVERGQARADGTGSALGFQHPTKPIAGAYELQPPLRAGAATYAPASASNSVTCSPLESSFGLSLYTKYPSLRSFLKCSRAASTSMGLVLSHDNLVSPFSPITENSMRCSAGIFVGS